MKITVLLENTALCDSIVRNHGLSLFVETPAHRILFDAGQDDSFLRNAATLGVDLTAADVAFLSHGHYDHSGGVKDFFRVNPSAPLYLHKSAFGEYYAKRIGGYDYIGIDPAIADHGNRIRLTDGDTVIDGELRIFSHLDSSDLLSSSNKVLLKKSGDDLVPDDFLHEQYLIISAEGKNLLLAGCCHRGIVNVMRETVKLIGKAPDYVFSGFHLGNPDTGAADPEELTRAIAAELKTYPSVYYTGHCTGLISYEILKSALGEQIHYLAGGAVINI